MTRFSRHSWITPVLALSCTALSFSAVVLTHPPQPAQAFMQDTPKQVVDEAWQIVNREYVDPKFNNQDWQAVRKTLLNRNYATKQQAYDALRDAFKKLDDVYTRFMDPKQFESLNSQTSGELSGVGIRLELPEDTKVLTVVEPIPNSPASKAGVESGDRILAINGKNTKGMSVEDASNIIRGEAGTKVTLKIGRKGEADRDQPLVRAKIELQTVRSEVRTEGEKKIGYIRLGDFSSHADEQMELAIKDLNQKQVEGFVLDLRSNPGGLLEQSLLITQMWLEKGDIVKTADRSNVLETVDRTGLVKTSDKEGRLRSVNRRGFYQELVPNNPVLSKLPLVVIVDGNSASSAEILTGALKDNKRATVVGTKTFGKALVQSVHPLMSDRSGLAVTIAHYYTPNGTDISKKGIAPDIVVELSEAKRKELSSRPKLIGTMADPQYAQAVSVLKKNANVAEKPVMKTGLK
jgi:carboxyl-terminal processing protease